MTTTTPLYGYGHYTMTASAKDSVLNFLDDYADDYDVDSLVAAYRDAINSRLAGTTIVLRGDDFYANYPAPSDAEDLIKDAIESVDLDGLAAEHEEMLDASRREDTE